MKELIDNFYAYRRRIVRDWNQYKQRNNWPEKLAAKKRENKVRAWLHHLVADPPEVLLGANFAPVGGVRHHLQAILKYSALNVKAAPSDQLLKQVGINHLRSDFHDLFTNFHPTGIRAVHSHVYPWFIRWSQELQKSGIRWVHTYHLNYYPEHSTQELQPWQQEMNDVFLNIAPQADVRLSVSRWQAEELMSQYGIETQYLPNGVDVQVCDSAKAQRFIEKTGFENFVLYVGRNDPVKNPVVYVQLASQLPEYQFIMVGGGLSKECLKDEWSTEVPKNLLLVGSLSHSEVQDAIAACSTLVVTSKREGLPTLVMEAMTQRKAVVVPNEAGCMEVVGGGEFGFVYELGNLDDLVEKTVLAIADTKFGERARGRVLEEYDWRVVAPKLDKVYRGEPLEC